MKHIISLALVCALSVSLHGDLTMRGLVGGAVDAAFFNTIVAESIGTADRKACANALIAESARAFKGQKHKAAHMQKVLRDFGIAGSVLAGLVVLSNRVFWCSIRGQVIIFPTPSSCLPLLALSIYTAIRASQRRKMHLRHAKHASFLFKLLHNKKFKESLDVEDWDDVAASITKIEHTGVLANVLPTLLLSALSQQSESRADRLAITAATVFAGYGIKPILTSALRKKEGVPNMDAAFNDAIAEREEGTAEETYGPLKDIPSTYKRHRKKKRHYDEYDGNEHDEKTVEEE